MRLFPAILIGALSIAHACGNPADGEGGIMAVVNVSSSSALQSALARAKAGDVIKLAPGGYGSVTVSDVTFSAPVTIISQDASRPAHFDKLMLKDVTNLTVKSVDVGDALRSGQTDRTEQLVVWESEKIVLDTVHVHGSLDNDATNDGYGLRIRFSHDVDVINSTFQQLNRALVISQSTDVSVVKSEFHNLRSDGVQVSETQGVLIDGNRFSSYHPVKGDHADAIQFFTSNTKKASTDIRIVNNVILQGDGEGLQGIFMRDEVYDKQAREGRTPKGLPYERVEIENNIIYLMDQTHGISVSGARDISIADNSTLSPVGDKFNVAIRTWRLDDAVIERNLADRIVVDGEMANPVKFGKGNIALHFSPKVKSQIDGLNDGAIAKLDELIVDGLGYQSGAQAAPKPAAPKPAAPKPAPNPPADAIKDTPDKPDDFGSAPPSAFDPAPPAPVAFLMMNGQSIALTPSMMAFIADQGLIA